MASTYPLDLNATLSGNYVQNQPHTISAPEDRLIILSGGAFYTKDLVVKDATTNQVLVPIVDYRALQLNAEATQASGKEVNSLLYISKTGVTSVSVSCRYVGGDYQNLNAQILNAINDMPSNQLGGIPWGSLIGVPNAFPPAQHYHLPDDWVGYDTMISLLEQIRQAVIHGNEPGLQALTQYIEGLIAVEKPIQTHESADGVNYLVGSGTTPDPLSVDSEALDTRYTQLTNLPITQIGRTTDFYIPISSAYYSILGPVDNQYRGMASYVEANGDLLSLIPTTNGETLSMVYHRVINYTELGVTSGNTIPTNRVYAPAGLAAGEFIAGVSPTTDTAMLVEIATLDISGVPTYQEHAIVILNNTLVDEEHQMIRIGNVLPTTLGMLIYTFRGCKTVVIQHTDNYFYLFSAKPDAVESTDIIVHRINPDGTGCIQIGSWTRQNQSRTVLSSGQFSYGTVTTAYTNRDGDLHPFDKVVSSVPSDDALIYSPDSAVFNSTPGISTAGTTRYLVVTQHNSAIRLTVVEGRLLAWPDPRFAAGSGILVRKGVYPAMTMEISFSGTNGTFKHITTVDQNNPQRNTITLATDRLSATVAYRKECEWPEIIGVSGGYNALVQILGDGSFITGQIAAGSNVSVGYWIRPNSMKPAMSAYEAMDLYSRNLNATTKSKTISEMYLSPPTALVPQYTARFVSPGYVLSNNQIAGHDARPNSAHQIHIISSVDSTKTRSYNAIGFGTVNGWKLNNNRTRWGNLKDPFVVTSVLLANNTAMYNNYHFPDNDLSSAYTGYGTLTVTSNDIQFSTPLTLSPAARDAVRAALMATDEMDSMSFEFLLAPDNPSTGILSVLYVKGQSGYTVYYQITVTIASGAITGVTLGNALLTSGPYSVAISAYKTESYKSNGALAIDRTVTPNRWLYRTNTFGKTDGGSMFDTHVRVFEESTSGGFNLTLSDTMNMGAYEQGLPTVHPALGVGIMRGNDVYGAMTTFQAYGSATRTVVMTPKPAAGFNLTVSEDVPVLMAGYSTMLKRGTYNLGDYTFDPSSKTFYTYIVLKSGVAVLDFRTTPQTEAKARCFIGTITTDTQGIVSDTLSNVTRLGLYRLGESHTGSSLVTTTGPASQSANANDWIDMPSINQPIRVGGLLLTLNSYKYSAEVRATEGYGVWHRVAAERTLVGQAYEFSSTTWATIIGNTYGELEHVLTTDELPSHTHTEMDEESGTAYPVSGPDDGTPTRPVTLGTFDSAQGTTADGYALQSGATGNNQAHNNVQPSLVVGMWKRLPNTTPWLQYVSSERWGVGKLKTITVIPRCDEQTGPFTGDIIVFGLTNDVTFAHTVTTVSVTALDGPITIDLSSESATLDSFDYPNLYVSILRTGQAADWPGEGYITSPIYD